MSCCMYACVYCMLQELLQEGLLLDSLGNVVALHAITRSIAAFNSVSGSPPAAAADADGVARAAAPHSTHMAALHATAVT
jgi:hypothetical protein